MKRACNLEQVLERKREIVEAVNKMFDEIDYQDISMKTISDNISIARSSLYCYYSSKEEIMLDLLKDNYLSFLNDLIEIIKNKDDIINKICNLYLNNTRLLKIISVHLIDIETHVSLESLINFKKDFVIPFQNLNKALKESYPYLLDSDITVISNSLIMFINSLYPMIHPNEIQKKAMEKVGMPYCHDPYSFCYSYLSLILNKIV